MWRWPVYVLAAAAVIAVLSLSVVIYVLGTESGTRLAFREVAARSPLEIDSDGISGTLLTSVSLPLVVYRDEVRRISIEQVSVNVDWTAAGPRLVALDRLAVQRLSIQRLQEEAAEAKPLEIAMPKLPVDIRASTVELRSLEIGDFLMSDLEVRDLRAHDTRFDGKRGAATIGSWTAQLSDFGIDLSGDVPVHGNISWHYGAGGIAGSGHAEGSLSELAVVHELSGDYNVRSRGTAYLLGREQLMLDVVNEFDELRFREFTAQNGRVTINGTRDQYRTVFDADVKFGDRLSATVRGEAAGDLRRFSQLDVVAENHLASMRATGSVDWSPALAIDLELVSQGLDPSKFANVPGGSLDATVRLLAGGARDFSVDVLSLGGRWNDQPVKATGKLTRKAERWLCSRCVASVGANRLQVDGELASKSVSGSVDIDAPNLGQLMSDLSGSLRGKGRLTGTLALPVLSGSATGDSLSFRQWSVRHITVESRGSTLEDVDVLADIGDIGFGEDRFGGGNLVLLGEPDSLELSVDWRLDDYAADLRAVIAIDGDAFSGTLREAHLSEPLTGKWSLDAPANFRAGPGNIAIGAATWKNGDATLRNEDSGYEDDTLRVVAALSGFSLQLLKSLVPENLDLQGMVDASVDLRHDSAGWNGNVEWQQSGTILRFIADEFDVYESHINVARASARMVNNRVTLNAALATERGTDATVEATLSAPSADANLDGQVRLSGTHWEWVPKLIPDIDNFAGAVNADIKAKGALRSPDLAGELNWTDGALAVPALNLPMSGINLTLTGSSAGDMTISGDMRSGDGTLTVQGRLDDVTSTQPSFDIRLLGHRATLLNWEDYRLIASPELRFAGDLQGVRVTGRVDMDKAEITLRGLPEGSVSPSDDVVVAGREENGRRRTRITGEVDIALSDDIHVSAFGLDTNLAGQLKLVVPEGREPQGFGELRLVGGVFEAYGQKLEIESGTMVFTGPLDDPLINVRAVRRVETGEQVVVAGINLTGRAQNLTSTLFSEPAMSEAEALSYVVLGRPLDQATAADGSNLSNSAYALGLRQAALITNEIGQAVGLDELTVGGNNQNTTELIAGKKINSRLYARFAYGVFNRIGKLVMRYKLSDSFSIEISAGENQSMDILYTIEKE